MDDKQVMHAMSVDDAYQVVRTLSGGPTGTTELVTIDGSGPFVRKKIPTDMANRAVWAILADCDCPYLPRVWATYELPDQFVVVCDFVAGTTLKDHVSSLERLAPRETAGLAENVCAAAESLHAHGVVHRDISPANVIVSSDGAHLIDLGIARTRFAHEDREGTHLGTWGFAAPEQYGFAQTDARSDVYSIGRLLGYMLTGASPDDDEYERLLQDRDVVPEPLAAVIARACDFEPSSRFQTADELARAICAAMVDEGERRGEGSPAGEPAAAPMHTDAASPSSDLRTAGGAQGISGHKNRVRNLAIVAAASAVGAAALIAVLVAINDGVPKPESEPNGTSDSAAAASDAREGETEEKAQDPAPAEVANDSAETGAESNVETKAETEATAGTGDGKDGEANGDGAADAPAGGLNATVTSERDSDASEPVPADHADQVDQPLQIVESWWGYQAGTLSCVYGVTNTSADTLVRYPEVRVTGRTEGGSVVHTQTDTFTAIYPGETIYHTLSTPCNVVPETVEFFAVEPRASFLEASNERGPVFSFSNLTDTTNGYTTTVTGELTAEHLPANRNPTPLFVMVILRDETGTIAGGTTAMVSTVSEGESVPFEAILVDPPDHASFEAHAQTW